MAATVTKVEVLPANEAPEKDVGDSAVDRRWLERRLLLATQAGLPLTPQPYHTLADALSLPVEVVKASLNEMRKRGAIRRIALVPNHYALGFRANGMSVWDVADDAVDWAGRLTGALDFVSHCYRRPRILPIWPFNLFAMVHGVSRSEVEEKVATIAERLAGHVRGGDVLYSTRILKKTGLRVREER